MVLVQDWGPDHVQPSLLLRHTQSRCKQQLGSRVMSASRAAGLVCIALPRWLTQPHTCCAPPAPHDHGPGALPPSYASAQPRVGRGRSYDGGARGRCSRRQTLRWQLPWGRATSDAEQAQSHVLSQSCASATVPPVCLPASAHLQRQVRQRRQRHAVSDCSAALSNSWHHIEAVRHSVCRRAHPTCLRAPPSSVCHHLPLLLSRVCHAHLQACKPVLLWHRRDRHPG